jgi:hypothetical protein
MTTNPAPTKLIEVALPLDVINREAAREKSIRHGHPSTLHLWWARRPWPHAALCCSPNSSTTPRRIPIGSRRRRRRTPSESGFSTSSAGSCPGRHPTTRRVLEEARLRSVGATRTAAGHRRPVLRRRLNPARSATAGIGGTCQRPQSGRCTDHQGADRTAGQVRGPATSASGRRARTEGHPHGGHGSQGLPRTSAGTASGCA